MGPPGDGKFNHFDTIYQCDRWMDRQTDAQRQRLHIAWLKTKWKGKEAILFSNHKNYVTCMGCTMYMPGCRPTLLPCQYAQHDHRSWLAVCTQAWLSPTDFRISANHRALQSTAEYTPHKTVFSAAVKTLDKSQLFQKLSRFNFTPFIIRNKNTKDMTIDPKQYCN